MSHQISTLRRPIAAELSANRFWADAKEKMRKGGAVERRELTVVVTAEVDCFRSADQLGTTPFVDTRATPGTF